MSRLSLPWWRAGDVVRIVFVLTAVPCAALAGLPTPNGGDSPCASGICFVDATQESGLDFIYRAGGAEALHLPAIMGGGAALFDAEGDGDLDLFFVQGGRLGDTGPEPGAESSRLYRNDQVTGPDGRRRARFVDVTRESGAGVALYGMGVATGDVDGDGDIDLFVTGFGGSRLLRNITGMNGDRGLRFEELSARAGLTDSGMAIAATFFDAERDGDLDLFVARYVDYPLAPPSPVSPQARGATTAVRRLSVPCAICSTSTAVTAPSSKRARLGSVSTRRSPVSGWSLPTSTAMAGSISSSPTTASPTTCGRTSDRARPAAPASPRQGSPLASR